MNLYPMSEAWDLHRVLLFSEPSLNSLIRNCHSYLCNSTIPSSESPIFTWAMQVRRIHVCCFGGCCYTTKATWCSLACNRCFVSVQWIPEGILGSSTRWKKGRWYFVIELADLEVDLQRRRSLGECQGLRHSLLRHPGMVSVQMARAGSSSRARPHKHLMLWTPVSQNCDQMSPGWHLTSKAIWASETFQCQINQHKVWHRICTLSLWVLLPCYFFLKGKNTKLIFSWKICA